LIVAVVAVVAAALTVALSVLPFARFAYNAPELHVAIETAAGVVGGLAAALFLARFLRGGHRSDLVLAWALGLFAVANIFLAALPAALAEGPRSDVVTWSAISCRLLGAGAFALAAFDDRVLSARRRPLTIAAALAGAALALAVLVPWLVGSWLPAAVDPLVSPEESGRPLLPGDPAVLALQLVALALFAAAAVGFTRKAAQTGDDLLRWIALGAVLAAAARLNYFLFPSLYSEWVYTGDFFRLAFYLSLLVGAVREVGHYWRGAADAAVLEERRRIARDLHDGLAQELAFIAVQAARLRATPEASDQLEPVETAARRALGEARRAIAALTRPLDEPFALVLADVAEEVAEREGLNVELSVRVEPDLPREGREELVRIAREAITNAARHARASTVRVEVANDDGVCLRVTDDGIGFDPSAPPRTSASGGFGLVSMHERARALGGELHIRSRAGWGTSVEVVVR
jgi:signal transduction histidine kinase